MEKISIVIKWRWWKWFGHALRMDNTRHAKIAFSWTPDSKRKRGCSKETWRTNQSKRQDLGSSHGLTQPKWPKKEIKWEDLLKARYSSGGDGYRQTQSYSMIFLQLVVSSDNVPASTGRRLQVLLHLPKHLHLVFSEFLILHFIYKMSVGQKRKFQSFFLHRSSRC